MNDIITNETVLNKHNKEHLALVECMDSALYEIWEYFKAGNTEAHAFMHSKTRESLVQFELDFENADIPEFSIRATYEVYEVIMAETMPVLNRLRNQNMAQVV